MFIALHVCSVVVLPVFCEAFVFRNGNKVYIVNHQIQFTGRSRTDLLREKHENLHQQTIW
jgi:hypothetical protein